MRHREASDLVLNVVGNLPVSVLALVGEGKRKKAFIEIS